MPNINVAMQVIVGAKPMNLRIVKEALIKRVKRNLSTTGDSYEYKENEKKQCVRMINSEIE